MEKGLPKHIIDLIQSKVPAGIGNFPPPAFEIIDSEFLEYEEGSHLTFRFPILEKYNNPMNITFGGYYGMFFDMVMGPFSALDAKGPATSLDLNITFLKALSPKDLFVDVTISIVSSTKSFFIVKGEAINSKDELVATSTSRMLVLNAQRVASA